jgi:DNA segregation ATPase FtsK/SpoIIIE, S-DNA-T family
VALRVRLELPGGDTRDVVVEIDPERRVEELAGALAGHLGLDAPPALDCARLGGALAPDATLRRSGLRSGDRLLVGSAGTPGPDRPRPLVELLVAGGPCGGRRVPLGPGSYRVGRSPTCDVVLADPAVSRVHLSLTVDATGGVEVGDAGSNNRTFLGGEPLTGPAPLGPGQVVELGRTLIAVAPAAEAQAPSAPDAGFEVAFNRPPRIQRAEPELTFELEAPPQRPRRPRPPVAGSLVPILMSGAMFAFTQNVLMLLFAALSPVMVVASLIEARFGGRRAHRRAMAEFERRLGEVGAAMSRAAAAEEERLRANAGDVATLVRRAETLDNALWERRPEGADFLDLRLGWGDRPSGIALRVGQGGDPEPRARATRAGERHSTLRAVPLVTALRRVGSVGVSGEPAQTSALARSLLLQVATLHSPDEVVVAAAVPSSEREEWAWLGWLPHARSERSPAGLPLVAAGAEAGALLERLLDLVERRGQNGSTEPAVVALLHESAGLSRGMVVGLLAEGPRRGVHAIWLGTSIRGLPGACGAVVEMDPATGGLELTLPTTGERSRCLAADLAPLPVAAGAALALAGVRDAGSRAGRRDIPARVALPAALGLDGRPEQLEAWWREDDGRLAAPIGVGPGGELFAVSLRDDGPHALVGGMTGAGKSGLLQTLVAALAARHSAARLNFLLIDYKGGTAFKDCVGLPHTVGFVTDLDGHLVNRALVSLSSELRRREAILRQAGASDLRSLERTRPDLAPPSLAIVVDEFAALIRELPDFVNGMVDIAQRGRSLGIHLVLATQRPQGVINDKIRANTNLRVSLRFTDAAESRDIVETAEAARPGLPAGRAFARVAGRITEFQAAYAGGRTPAERGPAQVRVRDIGFGGSPVAAADRSGEADDAPTDLVRLVALAGEANGRLGLPPPPRPWLPTLPEMLPLAALPAAAGGPTAVLGLVDEPAEQRQVALGFSLDTDANLLVYGTSGAGKTTLLRTLAVSLATACSPEQVHVYGLDFATLGLRPLEALPHCGGIVAGDEPERCARLLWMLQTEMERRRGVLAEAGAASLGEYLASGPNSPLPYVLVLLDGYPAFAAASQELDQGASAGALRTLVAEGRPLGIAFVVASDRQAPYLASISAGITRRVVLRMATDDEYSYLGLSRAVFKDVSLPPGRGFTERGLEVQCACPGEDPSGAAQVAAVGVIGAALAERYGAGRVPRIRLLPARVSRDAMPAPAAALEAVVGLEDLSLAPVAVDLAEGHFLVAGPRRSGRTTALGTIALSLAARGEADLHLLADRRQTALAALAVWRSTALGAGACAEAARRLATDLREAPPGATPRPCVVIVDDGEHLVDPVANRDGLDWLVQHGPEHGVHVVVAVEAQSAQRAFAPWLSQVIREAHGLLLNPNPAVDGAILGVRLPPRRGTSAPPRGRGYLVRQGVAELIQVAE